jgi:hypothetical protein
MESPKSNEDIAKQIILKEINNVSANSFNYYGKWMLGLSYII